MNLRSYREKDKENLRNVCIVTAESSDTSKEFREFLCDMYCDYYLEKEPQNCFSAVDDNDNAVGYILCSENYKKYEECFKKDYLPKIKRLGTKYYINALAEMTAHKIFSKKYPAHMHIDLLPEYQRMGLGTELLEVLKIGLSDKNIHSLMLIVGADNKKGVNFYKKNGFKIHCNMIFCYAMTLDF